MAEGRTITVVSTPSKLIDVVLAPDGSNFGEWEFLIRINLGGMGKDEHLTGVCPVGSPETVSQWRSDDKAILSRIINCIDRKIILSMKHSKTVKEVWDLVHKWFSGAYNLRRLYQLSQDVYRPSQKGRGVRDYYYEFKNVSDALCAAMPISNDVTEMKKQRDQLLVFSWISGLDREYDVLKSQLLGDKELESLDQVFARVQNASGNANSEDMSERHVFLSQDNMVEEKALLSQGNGNDNRGGRSRGRGRGGRGGGRGGQRVCYNCGDPNHLRNQCPKPFCYACGDPGHLRNQCPKLIRPQRFANSVVKPEGHTVVMTDEDLTLFNQLKMSSSQPPTNHDSLSSRSATLVQTGNPVACVTSSSSRKWVIDSGASDHMSGNPSLFSTYSPFDCGTTVTLADGSSTSVVGKGNAVATPGLSLSSVLYLPKFPFNLLSISQITRALNCCVSFFPGYCVFQDLLTKKIIGRGKETGGLYVLEQLVSTCSGIASVSLLGNTTPFQLHCRYGHPSLPTLKKLCPSLESLSVLQCESCELAKHCRGTYFPRVNNRVESLFQLVHTDVWGPCRVSSKSRFRYFVTFVDDFSRHTWLYLMKSRDELFAIFCNFCVMVRTQFNKSIQILRSDNALEYFSGPFSTYMSQNGMIHQSSCVGRPQQNGVAERKNRHLLEVARALLFQMKVPKVFWSDAVHTASFLINRLPSSVLHGQVPCHLVYPSSPLFHLSPKVFGCTCFVQDIRPQKSKLDPKSLKCLFLGYSLTQKGYRCYSPELKRYLVSADVTFFEDTVFSGVAFDHPDHVLVSIEDTDFLTYTVTVPSSWVESIPRPPVTQVYNRRPRNVVQEVPSLPPVSSTLPQSSSTDLDLPIALRKGKRRCCHPISSFVSYNDLSPSSRAFVSQLDSVVVPESLSYALSHDGWRRAMEEEMAALEENKTWDLVDLPAGKAAIGCKWVYVVKMNPDGSVARLKARLVAKGYAQMYGVDYTETFSPVAKLTSVRIFVSLAAINHWPLYQLDVKNAFLHGDLSEEVYMEQPPGFVAQGESEKVCKLKKSLYGLRQSPRAWFGRFSSAVIRFGMQRSAYDHTMFYKLTDCGCVLLIVYVDDIVITGSDTGGIGALKSFLKDEFHTKDLGILKYFLGVEVSRSKKGIFLSQRKYVLDLLGDTGMLGVKPCDTAMDPGVKLVAGEGQVLDNPERYRRLVGKLNYLTITRPDIAFPVSVVSQFMSEPTQAHWEAAIRIVKYLKGAPGKGVLYADYGHTSVEAFSDADWAGSPSDRRSTTGYCVFVGGNLVSWKSKKQSVVARSSAESEYRAMAHATCEITWIRNILEEIGVRVSVPVRLWCDNQAAIHISNNPVFHERTKHIEVDCHFVREKIQQGLIRVGHVQSGDQLADVFTKGLGRSKVEHICNKLGMVNIYAPA